MHTQLAYQIALTLLPGIGPVKAKNLIAYCGSAEAIFTEKKSSLHKIPNIGGTFSSSFKSAEILLRAEKEISFMEANHVKPIFFTDKTYPDRLKACEDSPVMLYTKGKMDLSVDRVISIVGTRKATSYGKSFCNELLTGIAHLKPLVVSGLAYGIDICAHRNAVANKLQTVACVAHGLEKIYPALHTTVANEMTNNGGLISEFISDTRMTPELFPMRNRIIAGLADCTIVIETDMKGGSTITAHLANSYGREVFALPGRYMDKFSSGCNALIKKNLAAILSSPEDLIQYMNWDITAKPIARQIPMFTDLTTDENAVIKLLTSNGRTDIDHLSQYTGFLFSKLSPILLELEFKGVLKPLPGKLYELV